MAWVAPAIGAGASILGGVLGSSGASKAAKAQSKALAQQLALQQQMYYSNLGVNEPWRATGQGALNQLARLYGLPYQSYQSATDIARANNVGESKATFKAKDIVRMLRSGKTVEDIARMGTIAGSGKKLGKRINYLSKYGLSPEEIQMLQNGPGQFVEQAAINNVPQEGQAAVGPDMSVFTSSPGYQFRRSEGQRDIGNTFAARGGAFGGNALRALTDFNQNLASDDYYNYVNQMNTMAGLGQTATNNATNMGQNYSAQAGNTYANMGNARASGIANQYNMIGQGFGGASNAFGNYWDSRNPSGYSYSSGLGRYQTTPVYPGGAVPMLPQPELPPLRIG